MVKHAAGLKLLSRLAGGTTGLIRRAGEAQHRRSWAEAETLWRQVVERAPRDAGAWVQLGNMLNELNRRDEAIAAFQAAAAVDPGLAHAPAGIAGVHERAGRWTEAGEAWIETIGLLSDQPRDKKTQEALTHAFAHAMLAARNSGSSLRGQRIAGNAMDLFSDMKTHPETLAIRAALLPPEPSEACRVFLQDFLAFLSAASGKPLKPSAGIEKGDLFQGLLEISPYLEEGRGNPTFLRVATDLYENARLWPQAVRLAEWHADIEPGNADIVIRAFRAASSGRRLADARRLASRHARQTGDLMLVHNLAELYDTVGWHARARLLLRFLKRRWPHSRWHACRYIVATATTRSLPLADHLVRKEIDANRHDQELEAAYCRAAFAAGHYEDARLRLTHYLDRHEDEDAEVLLGYVIANTSGIDKAADYFHNLAARRMQPLSAMVGMAHMAMRQRDLPQALDRWRDIATVHSSFVSASVEMARCAYDIGNVADALGICRAHLNDYPHDIGMGEFYAWLLTMNGRYEAALPAIKTILANSGPNWQAVDLHIICSSQLGTLDQDWDSITAMVPAADSAEAGSRFYHVMRILIAVERRDLAMRILLSRKVPIGQLPWAAPYLQPIPRPITDPQIGMAEERWKAIAAMTRADFSKTLDVMSDLAVDVLLGKRRADLPVVHIVNKFEQPRGGSELHALDLAEQIGRHANVRIWAPEMPHSEFSTKHGVSHIDPTNGLFPQGGVLVFIGIYFDIAKWIRHTKPERVIFLYNTFEAPSLFTRIEEAWRLTGIRPELLYCANIMQRETGLPGRFEPSPTDLEQFSPTVVARPPRPFTIGRHSRDVPEKHGRDDWRIYQQVSELGGESLVLGGACMSSAFPAIPGLHLLKARSTGIPEFLHGLDAYIYRTSTWIEPWGRVVIEAMACGLPVLVHSVGGYAQAITHEANGLLFDTTEEAMRLVRRLAQEPELRSRLGHEARQSVCNLLSPPELKRMIAFYLLGDRL